MGTNASARLARRKPIPVHAAPATITTRASSRSSSHPTSGTTRPAASPSVGWRSESWARVHPQGMWSGVRGAPPPPRGGARAKRGAGPGSSRGGGETPPIEKAWRPGSPGGGGVPIVSHEASVPQRYGVALAATTVAYGALLLLWPLIDPNAFAPFCAAVMVSAWYGGLGPGLLATRLATRASPHPLPSPGRTFQAV